MKISVPPLCKRRSEVELALARSRAGKKISRTLPSPFIAQSYRLPRAGLWIRTAAVVGLKPPPALRLVHPAGRLGTASHPKGPSSGAPRGSGRLT